MHITVNVSANEDKILKPNISKVKPKFKDKATDIKPHQEPKYIKSSKIESVPVANIKDGSTNEITEEIIKIDRGDGSHIKHDEIFAIYRQENRTSNEEHEIVKVNKTDNKAKKENDEDDKKEGKQKIIKKQFKIIRKCFKPLMRERTSGKVVCECLKSQQKSKILSAERLKEECLQLELPLCKKCFKPKQTYDGFSKNRSIRFCECKHSSSKLNQEAKLNPALKQELKVVPKPASKQEAIPKPKLSPCQSQLSGSKTKRDPTNLHVEPSVKVKPEYTSKPRPLLNKGSVLKCKCLKKRTLLESVLCKYTKNKTKLGKTICAECTCEEQSSEIEKNAAVTLNLEATDAKPMYRPCLDFKPKLKSVLQPKSLPNPKPKQGLAYQHIKSMESVFLSSLSLDKLVPKPNSDLEFKPELAPRNVNKIEAKLGITVSKCCVCEQLLPNLKTEIKPNQTSEINPTSKLKSDSVTKTASKLISSHIVKQAAVSNINLGNSHLVVAKAKSKQQPLSKQKIKLTAKLETDTKELKRTPEKKECKDGLSDLLSTKPNLDYPKVLKPELITIYKQKSIAKHEQGSSSEPAQYQKPELTQRLSEIRTETNPFLSEDDTESKRLFQSQRRNVSKTRLKSELPLMKTKCIKCLKDISNQNLLDYLDLNNSSTSKKTLTHKSKQILKVAQVSESKLRRESKLEPETKLGLERNPRLESEAKLQSKSKAAFEDKIEANPKVALEDKSKSKLESVAKAESNLKVGSEAKVVSKQKVGSEAKVESKPKIETAAKLESKSKVGFEAKVESSLKAGSEAKVESKLKLGPGARVQSQLKVGSAAKVESKPKVGSDTKVLEAEVKKIEPETPTEAVETPVVIPAETLAAGSNTTPVVPDEELSPYCTHCEENKVICECHPPQSEYCKKCGHILKLVCECYGEKKKKTISKDEQESETKKSFQDADVETVSGKKPKFMTDGLSEMVSGFKVNLRKKRVMEKQTKSKAGEWSLEDALRYVAHTNPELLGELLPIVAKDNKIEGICMPRPKDGDEFPRAILEEPVPAETDLSDENEEHAGLKMTKLPYTRRRRRR